MSSPFDRPRGENLVGLTEIAMRAGISKAAVSMWRTRHDAFPAPLVELRTGAIFWWPEVEAWMHDTGRPLASPPWTLEQVNAYNKRDRKLR